MKRDPQHLNGYLALITTAELQDRVLIGATKESDGFILAGAHAADGFCWCQPVVIYVPCASGMRSGEHMDHAQINHRRSMDDIGGVLEDESETGFSVDSHGHTYPRGQTSVGPGDAPAN